MATKGWSKGTGLQAARKQAGDAWEAEIQQTIDVYYIEGLAWIRRAETPTMQIGPTDEHGRFTAVRTAPQGCDFVGTVKGGRSIAIEAKSCSNKDRFSLGEVKPSQARHMLDVSRAGGIAGVLVYWSRFQQWSWIPALPLRAAAVAIHEEWCSRACSPERELGVVTIPGVKLEHLRDAGLCDRDWLAVARREAHHPDFAVLLQRSILALQQIERVLAEQTSREGVVEEVRAIVDEWRAG